MKNTVLIVSVLLLYFACNEKQDDVKKNRDNKIENILSDTANELVSEQQEQFAEPVEINEIEEEIIAVEPDSLAVEKIQNDSSGIIYAKFIHAGMVEGDVGLFFSDENGEDISYWEFDFDPVEEGLFTYKAVEGAVFPELVTNPEIEDITFKLYWKIERRYIDLADEETDVVVLKKIERVK